MVTGSIVVGLVAVCLLIGLLGRAWGDDVWQWADRNWPGGAYVFAVCLGIAGPCLGGAAMVQLLLAHRASQKVRSGSGVGRAVLGAAFAVAFAAFLSLAWDAVFNDSYEQQTGPPSWVFSHLPWLWAVGTGASATTVAVAILIARCTAAARRSRSNSA